MKHADTSANATFLAAQANGKPLTHRYEMNAVDRSNLQVAVNAYARGIVTRRSLVRLIILTLGVGPTGAGEIIKELHP